MPNIVVLVLIVAGAIVCLMTVLLAILHPVPKTLTLAETEQFIERQKRQNVAHFLIGFALIGIGGVIDYIW